MPTFDMNKATDRALKTGVYAIYLRKSRADLEAEKQLKYKLKNKRACNLQDPFLDYLFIRNSCNSSLASFILSIPLPVMSWLIITRRH